MRKDSPLAEKEVIHATDLTDLPLIVSRQQLKNGVIHLLAEQAGSPLDLSHQN